MIKPILAAMLTSLPVIASAQDAILKVGTQVDIRSTNPGVDRSAYTDGVLMNVVEGLVGYRDDLSVGPVLAEEIQLSEDGLTYTFPLRRGVTFHNGAEMTAETVLWSWNRLMAEDTGWRCRDRFDGTDGIEVTSVTAPDPYTVVYQIDAPSPLFLKELARFDCGSAPVLHPDSLKADGSWNGPVGTGPFVLEQWRPGERIRLKKFDGYVSASGEMDGYTGEKTVNVDRVDIIVVPDPASAKAALRAGDIDLFNINVSDIAEFREAGFTVLTEPTPSWSLFLISRHDETLANPALRQALARSLDLDQIAMLMGEEAANASPIPPISSFYTEVQSQRYGYDPEAARALVEESGYDGSPITLTTTKQSERLYNQSLIAQSMWRKVGLNVEIEVMDWGSQLDLYQSGKYQMQSFGFSPRLDPALSWDMFSGEHPRKVWNDPKALKLIEALKSETDTEARAALSDQLHLMFLEAVPAIGLFSQLDVMATSDRVQDFRMWPGGQPRFWNVGLDAGE
ncbi:ABC transporter substrate-binding protein [Ponticoccus alexandrii]|uniref:ABC transporter substrate-binding protein n=1 Tax=Ponticoccus alexandrii TaxID=1943633 RepID=A0ABX7FFX3_9RHOB|nr:ABC transporter substrate-binding protein [Ponticoccus alexandrii]ETA49458.2 hypothetical protein P279_24610 [Rhodobacteraceae bacterium PD-2]QRF69364.1 ABC transporter substrate-binding protein [Ponticoccus alexandrii]